MSSNQPADLNNRSGKIFVLVHGAGQGAWAFGKVAWPLARDGHHVIARDLPGHGLRARTYISCTADFTIPAAAHRLFIDAADKLTPGNRTDVREMPTSHCPFLSEPEELARALLQL
jgi:pimeloyl-ACP methyl ester carboxylesterase